MKSIYLRLIGTMGVALLALGIVVQQSDAAAIVVVPITNNCLPSGTGANPVCTGTCVQGNQNWACVPFTRWVEVGGVLVPSPGCAC